ncbi:metallophosphoesterase [Mesorhizobium muleiense]|uniref:metallophosphoesterase n=1 Tax=Mesorhizobium muleiense TaxID=1004279 RepID=UPI001F1748FE|nr:metallophosphoesterase [Mesorhizobium muleiense]MCF6117157.1 metallophosphoesterase [Mesorhizobium muleiense]
MAAIFVHVSDIHFGQERDHVVHIHDDVKKELVSDAAEVIAGLQSGATKGILVTGDIAFSGKADQYVAAGKWLDTLAEGIGCPIHRVQMIPGNHDMDRDKLSVGGGKLLDFIRAGGPAEYEKVISNENDRATLFSRFEDYGRFCIGYSCDLDQEAKYATNLRIEVGPNRWLRFVRLNSSLLCHGEERDDQPELVMGERQFVIPRYAGEENVVLAHHPLNWYKDAADVRQYVRSRARVFISGHEHDPKVNIDRVENGCDVMMLAAGAAVPFRSNDIYTFTYNILEFDWDDGTDNLVVTIHPRAWNPVKTCFEADDKRLGGKEPRFTLGSPNFKKVGPVPTATAEDAHGGESDTAAEPNVELVPAEGVETNPRELAQMPPDAEGYELALLRFFRDLYESERLKILVELDALPAESDERMNQGLERRLFDWLVREGRLPDINSMIERLIGEREERDV